MEIVIAFILGMFSMWVVQYEYIKTLKFVLELYKKDSAKYFNLWMDTLDNSLKNIK